MTNAKIDTLGRLGVKSHQAAQGIALALHPAALRTAFPMGPCLSHLPFSKIGHWDHYGTPALKY